MPAVVADTMTAPGQELEKEAAVSGHQVLKPEPGLNRPKAPEPDQLRKPEVGVEALVSGLHRELSLWLPAAAGTYPDTSASDRELFPPSAGYLVQRQPVGSRGAFVRYRDQEVF